MAFLGIGTWTTYWFFSRHVRERFDPIIYFACVMLAGALTMTPVALVTNGVPSGIALGDVLAVVTVALLPGFVGHTLVIWSHKHVASWLSALITQVSPVITVVLAWIVLGESITRGAILGRRHRRGRDDGGDRARCPQRARRPAGRGGGEDQLAGGGGAAAATRHVRRREPSPRCRSQAARSPRAARRSRSDRGSRSSPTP